MPWPLHGGLSSGMGELYRWHRPHAANEARNPRQRLGMRIGPDAKIPVGNPASSLHCRGLGKDNPSSSLCKFAKVHHVPVIGESIARAVLTHR
jgi:hypothetical protein